MQIENINGLTKLIADENKYITTVEPPKDNEIMLSKVVYLGKYDGVENYKEIGDNDFPINLDNKLKDIEEINKSQDELIDISLLATDEMYLMIEPLLSINTMSEKVINGLANLYVAMVMRELKTIEEVPDTFKNYVLEKLKNNN